MSKAQYNLGEMYERGGYGVTQDYEKAAQWYQKAADQGDIYAQARSWLSCMIKVGG